MGNDQVVFRIHRYLNVVAHDAGAPAAGRHRARIGIGQRELLIRRRQHLGFQPLQTLHLLLQFGDLVGQPLDLGLPRK